MATMQKESDKIPQDYYDSDSAFKYYSTIQTTDYSGIGIYPEQEVTAGGFPRGSGVDSGAHALQKRDAHMLELILKSAPAGKLRGLDLGSGRGGLARFIAGELKGCGRLEQVIASNISGRENDYNAMKAKEMGLSDAEYRVDLATFDDLSSYETGSFDLVMSNDSFLYSADKAKLMRELARLLKPSGVLVFSDILQSKDATPEQLADVYKRLSLAHLGTSELYSKELTGAGLTVVSEDVSGQGILRHYGFMRWSASENKTAELLAAGVEQEFIDKQLVGLAKWQESAEAGLVQWGWFVYRNSGKMQKESDKIPQDYYDSDSAFKYYSTIQTTDYSGIGIYPEQEVTAGGFPRGSGVDSGAHALQKRDAHMLELILKSAPAGKLRGLDLGSGRGGLARFIAGELKGCGRLEQVIASNISGRENDYNAMKAKEMGLSDAEYRVDLATFDDLSSYETGSFDLVMSNDSFLYSADKAKLMRELARLLKPSGVLVFSDILQSKDATPEQLADVYKRLSLTHLGTSELYSKELTGAGLTVVSEDVSGQGILRHYGFMRWSASENKTAELLAAGVEQEFIDKQLVGLAKWQESAEAGLVQWGWFVYRNSGKMQKESDKIPQDYYDSDSAFKYYSTIQTTDYSGIGIYPEQEVTAGGFPRGSGVDSGAHALQKRDAHMLELILKSAPAGKLRGLDLGSGRGGLARFIAGELKGCGRLEQVIASNISGRENDYNAMKAKEMGLSDAEYRVDLATFDDLSSYETGSFDLVMSNDSFLYSADKAKLMRELARLLKPSGVLVFSDILQSKDATPEQLADVYKRLSLAHLGTSELYSKELTGAGLTVVSEDVSGQGILRHYGFMRWSASENKTAELLAAGVEQEFIDKQLVGLAKWQESAEAGLVQWGWFVYRNSGKMQKESDKIPQDYYDSDSAFKYYSTIQTTDYSGIGIYPEQEVTAGGFPRGSGVDSGAHALQKRDAHMLELILKSAPAGKLRGLDLGSGRGGLARFIAGELKGCGRLEQVIASNISGRENDYNAMKAKEMGLSDAEYCVDLASFDDLSSYETGSFDLVMSNDSFLYSADKAKLMRELARLLKPSGVLVFSDILQSKDATPEQLADVYKRLSLAHLGTSELYSKELTGAGLTVVSEDVSGQGILRHYGFMRWSASENKTAELLAAGVEQEFIDKQLVGLAKWQESAEAGLVQWGWFVYRNSGKMQKESDKIPQDYYDSDSAFKYYSTIQTTDYSGIGIYPEQEVTAGGFPRGSGVDSGAHALQKRDAHMLELILKSAPAGKLRGLDLGSGRGGLARFIAGELKGCGRLEQVIASNISGRENDYNAMKAKEMGLSDAEYRVDLATFDDLSSYETGSFDLVMSNDSFLYSADKAKLMRELARLLKPSGVLVFSDILQSKDATPEQLADVYKRLSLAHLGTSELYSKELTGAGLTVVSEDVSGQGILRHYGFMRWSASENKTAELLAAGVEQEFIDKQLVGLAKWQESAEAGLVQWGWFVYRNSGKMQKESDKIPQDYYDSDSAFKYYSTIQTTDYSGIGIYPEQEVTAGGFPRGSGVDSGAHALQKRDAHMLELILKSAPAGKLRGLDLGSGRGGLARFIAGELKGCGRLEQVIASNISGRENDYNAMKAKEMGLSDAEYCVDLASFDDLSSYETGSFDLVMSNDSFLYSADKAKLMRELARLLKPSGVLVFSDILQSKDATPEQLADVYKRLSLTHLGTSELYSKELTGAGLTVVSEDVSGQGILRHYGFMRWSASENKTAELLAAGVEQEFIDKQLVGLAKWQESAEAGLVQWGWFVYRNSGKMQKESDKIPQDYYDSDSAFKYYSTIQTTDYSGIGIYPEQEVTAGGFPRGSGVDSGAHALQKRDAHMLELILKSAPAGKLRGLDLGSGRGGLARFIAGELKGCGRLEQVIASNISGRENDYNAMKAKEMGLSDAEYCVDLASFDDLSSYETGSFDLVMSNDSFLYSADKAKLMRELARLLKPSGVLVFSDILQSKDATPEQLADVYKRLSLTHLGTSELYSKELTGAGLTAVSEDVSGQGILRHYGFMRWSASENKTAELLAAGVEQEFIDKQLVGLAKWQESAEAGLVQWGWFVYRNSGKMQKESDKIPQDYYDSDSAFKYYSTIQTTDYSGIGIYPEQEVTAGGFPRGSGVDSGAHALQKRDAHMLELILKSAPAGKLRGLDLGSGRGGLARFIAGELKGCGRLEQVIASNISGRENDYNAMKAKEMGLSDAEYRVDLASFDDLSSYETGSFDLVMSNDSFLYSADKAKLMRELARLLKPSGVLVFSDILQSKDATPEQLADVYKRLSLTHLGTSELYSKELTGAGLTVVSEDVSGQGILRHYGFMRWSASENKTAELLAAGVEQEFIDKQLVGLAKWQESAEAGLVQWGWFVYRNSGKKEKKKSTCVIA